MLEGQRGHLAQLFSENLNLPPKSHPTQSAPLKILRLLEKRSAILWTGGFKIIVFKK
jgi:hypothetical protein